MILASAAPPALPGPADDQYAVAAGHYKQKRWKFAVEEFKAFLDQNPQHASAAKARFYLGESLLQLRRFDEAAEAFRAFAKHAPQDRLAPKARFRAAEAVYLAGRYDEAKTELERFYGDLPNDPLNAYVVAYLGEIAARKNDSKLSRRWYEEALRRFPQSPLADDCRFGLARALETEGELEDARRLYLALASKPKSALADKAQFRLGASFYAGGDYEQSLASFQELLDVPRFAASPWRLKAALAAGESLYQLNRLDEAAERFEALADDKSAGAEARYWLGLVQAARHDWLTAADTLLRAAEQSAADSSAENKNLAAAALFQAGDALLHAGKKKEAQEQFQRVLKTWPKSEYAEKSDVGLVQVALFDGDHKLVDRLATQFAERHPKSSLASQVDRLVGRSLLARKNFTAAASTLERLVAADKADSTVHQDADRCLLSAAYTGLGRFEDALQAVGGVATSKELPNSPDSETDTAARQLWIDAHRQRATALVGLNRFADALPVLERLLTAAPDPSTRVWTQAELAVCLAKTNELARAKTLYSEQLSQAPDTDVLPPAMLALADAALEQSDAAWAADLFERLAANNSTFQARALWGLARSRVKQGDTSQAVAALDRLVAAHADDPLASQAAVARGQLFEQLKDDEAALRSYRQVIDKYGPNPERSPELAPALLAAARAENRLKRPQAAAALYEQLDRQFPAAPDHEAALYEWAWALRDAGEADQAAAIFERVRAAMPKSRFWADAVYRLAQRAYETKDYARAGQLTSELIGSNPGGEVLPHALYLEAQIAAAQNEWPKTTAPLERLLAEFPESPMVPLARYMLAEAAYREAEFDRAAEAFRELAESTRGRRDKWLAMIPLRRAQILARNKQWHDALEMASQIETDFPDFEQQYEVDYVIGRCQASLANFDDARAAYRRVVKSETGAKTETAAKAQWMIGETFFHQKNFESALREYLRVEILYDYPTWQAAALFEAAKCHENLGEPKQAAELYAKVVKSYPDSPLVKDATQRLSALETRVQK